MKKRMKLLGLLLAGGIALGSSDVIYVQGAQNQAGGAPVAGVSEVFAEMIAELEKQRLEEYIAISEEQVLDGNGQEQMM